MNTLGDLWRNQSGQWLAEGYGNQRLELAASLRPKPAITGTHATARSGANKGVEDGGILRKTERVKVAMDSAGRPGGMQRVNLVPTLWTRSGPVKHAEAYLLPTPSAILMTA